MYKLKRLSNKVFIVTMFFYIVVVAAVTAWVVNETYVAAKEGVIRELSILEASFSTPLAQALWTMDKKKIAPMVEGLIQLPGIDGLRIMDTLTGRALAWKGLQPPDSHTQARRETELPAREVIAHSFELYHEEGAYIDKLGEVFFYVDAAIVWQRIEKRVKKIIIGAAAQVVVLWFVIYLVGRRIITAPLKRLTRAVNRFDLDDPDMEPVPIDIKGDDELAHLGNAFGAMEKRLTETVTDLRTHKDHLEDLVTERTTELKETFDVLTSSIQYASRIQRSVLPPAARIDDLTVDHFILWEPRDVVGGDMYWCELWGEGSVIILGDCTGHGVPGAFMTLLATGALKRGLAQVEEGDAAGLLSAMHRSLQHQLGQCEDRTCTETSSDDGLELGICYLAPDNNSVTYAGARMQLFIEREDGIEIIKGNNRGIAYRGIAEDFQYTNRIIDLHDETNFIMISDGILDQIGGEKRRGFGKKRFLSLLDSIRTTPMRIKGKRIHDALADYQGDEKRRDDVSAIGFTL